MIAIPGGWALRVGVSTAIIAILLVFVPVRTLAQAIARVDPRLWLAVLGGFLVCHVAAALKWRLLMVSVAGVPKRLSIAAHFSGLVANLGLPSVSGGDIVRAAVVFRHASHRAPVALASVADRMIDFVALLVLSFTGLLLAGPRAGDPVLVLRFVALVMTVSLVAGALAYLYLRRRPLPPMLVRVVAATEVLLSRPGRVLVALGVSCLVQTTLVVLNWQLGRAVGVQVGLDVWLLAWPLAKLVALVPISLAGLGVREASLIGLMRPFGVPAGGIVAAGLLWHSVLVTGGPVGLALARLFTLRPRIQPQGAIAP